MKKNYLTLLISIIGFSAFAQNNQVRQFKFDASVSPDNYYSDQVVFKLKEEFSSTASARFIADDKFQVLSKELGGVDLKQFFDVSVLPNSNLRKRESIKSDLSRIYEMKITKSLQYSINKLIKSGLVEYAEPKFISRPLYVPSDPDADSLAGGQYYLKLIKAYEAWNDVANRGDASAILGIVDTGFELTNPDIAGNIAAGGKDLGDNDNDPTYVTSDHGAGVASLSSAITDNGVGLAGTGFNSKYLPIKAAASDNSNIVAGFEGIEYAFTNGCRVVNCSWGHYGYSQAEQELINTAVLINDLLIVAAAGNTGGKNSKIYPACYDNVLSVTHTTASDTKINGDYNNSIDIAAPGTSMIVYRGNGSKSTNGGSWSSFAAPIVSGAATALRFKFPDLNALQIAEILRMSADIIDTIPANAAYKGLMGRGRLNMFEAFKGMQTPSVRLLSTDYNSNLILKKGDTLLLKTTFINYLLPTSSNAKIKIRIDNPNISIIDSVFDVGVINSLAQKNNNATPFKFVFKNNCPIEFNYTIKFVYEDGQYLDYQLQDFIFNSAINIDLDENKLSMTITSVGKNGFEGDFYNGIGLIYNNKQYLYSSGLMIGTSKTKVVDAVVDDFGGLSHFNPLEYVTINNNTNYGKLITSKFDDSNFSNKIGVEVLQKSFAWNTSTLDKSIVIEYKIKNTSGVKFDSLCVGLYSDIDVETNLYASNRTKWDATHHVGYAFNVSTNAHGYAGFKVLTPQKENFYATDNSDNISNNINPYSEFSVENKFKTLSSGIARSEAGLKSGGNNVSTVIGATVYNLEPNATTTVAFAYIMADSEAEMLTNADAIQAKYVEIRKGVKPVIADKVVCLNQKATLNPTGGTAYEFYKASTIANQNLLSAGNSYLTNNIAADTAFYIVNKDSIFDSDVTKVKVNVSKLNPDFTYTLENSQGKVAFESANDVSFWNWNFGDNSTGSGKLTNNVYASANTYDVKMVITNNIGCKDSITKQVEVSNFVTSSTDLKLQKGEVFNVYPNPSNGNINLNIRLNSTETIAVKVSDVIGNVVIESNGIPESLDLSNQKSGLYILQVKTGERVITQKIEITK